MRTKQVNMVTKKNSKWLLFRGISMFYLVCFLFLVVGCSSQRSREEVQRDEKTSKEIFEKGKNEWNEQTKKTTTQVTTTTDSLQMLEDTETVLSEDPMPVQVWMNGNDEMVDGGNAEQPQIVLSRDTLIVEIYTYHWNGGNGQIGPGTISMESETNISYGPWAIEVMNDVYWIAKPNEVIPKGTYTIVDSDPGTWAQNKGTNGTGMCWSNGIPQ